MTKEERPLQILLIEDNPMDILITTEALQNWRIKHRLDVIEDGQEAFDFIYGRGICTCAVRPDLIILDLNLPQKSGKEILMAMNQDADLSHIAVAVVTTSDAEIDRQTCLNLGAKLFITKPLNIDEYTRAIDSIQGLL